MDQSTATTNAYASSDDEIQTPPPPPSTGPQHQHQRCPQGNLLRRGDFERVDRDEELPLDLPGQVGSQGLPPADVLVQLLRSASQGRRSEEVDRSADVEAEGEGGGDRFEHELREEMRWEGEDQNQGSEGETAVEEPHTPAPPTRRRSSILSPSPPPKPKIFNLGVHKSKLREERLELESLLKKRSLILQSGRSNAEQQKWTFTSLKRLKEAYEELKDLIFALNSADLLREEEEGNLEVRNLQAWDVSSPFTLEMVSSDPLLRLQSKERDQVEALITPHLWGEREKIDLRRAILVSCQRNLATRFAREGGQDPLERLERLSEEEVLSFYRTSSSAVRADADHGPRRGGRQHGTDESREQDPIDWEFVARLVPGRSARDCKTVWMAEEDPFMNRRRMSEEEQTTLRDLVSGYERRGSPVDWEAIANRLGKSRTGFDCFAAYRKVQLAASADESWTAEDDRELLDLWSILGPQWSQISSLLSKSRPSRSCWARINRVLDTSVVKGKWTLEEDEMLISAMAEEEDAKTDWSKVSMRVPGRTSQQCRERWTGRLKVVVDLRRSGRAGEAGLGRDSAGRERIRIPWTKEEDEKLVTFLNPDFTPKPGYRWTTIANEFEEDFRSDKSVRERSILLKKRAGSGQGPSKTGSVGGGGGQGGKEGDGVNRATPLEKPKTDVAERRKKRTNDEVGEGQGERAKKGRKQKARLECPHEGCTENFGRKDAMERHRAKVHGAVTAPDEVGV